MAIERLTPDRRRQQTRDTLIEAAAQVFGQRGFNGATLDEVAAVAGFTKGAVYSNFKSKDDLFLAVLESRFDRNLASLEATLDAADGEPDEHLFDFIDNIRPLNTGDDEWGALYSEFCLYARRNPGVRAKLAAFQRADVSAIARIIQSQHERHGITSDEPDEHLARIVVALTNGLSSMRLVDETIIDDAVLRSVMTFIGRAMIPTERQETEGRTTC
jgi:AcrR family transcriptional regulator